MASGLAKYFSPLISAYRKGYGAQHILTRLIEEWRTQLDNNHIVGAILIDLSKLFDCISCSFETNFYLCKITKTMCLYKKYK